MDNENVLSAFMILSCEAKPRVRASAVDASVGGLEGRSMNGEKRLTPGGEKRTADVSHSPGLRYPLFGGSS